MADLNGIGGALPPSQIVVGVMPVRNPLPKREVGGVEVERAISLALGCPTETDALLAFDQLMDSMGIGGAEASDDDDDSSTPGVARGHRLALRDQVLAAWRANKETVQRTMEIARTQLSLWEGIAAPRSLAENEADQQRMRDSSTHIEELAIPGFPPMVWPENSQVWFGVKPGQTVEKAARGGKYYRRTEDENGKRTYHYSAEAYLRRPDAHVDGPSAIQRHLHGRVRKVLETGPAESRHFDHLTRRFGHTAVARAIHHVGGRHVEGKVVLVHKKPLHKGKKVAPPGAGGAGGGSSGDPVGTIEIWGYRVMEKQEDGQWHVIAHVAGLEGEAIPRDVVEKLREYLRQHPSSIHMMTSDVRERIIFTLRATDRGLSQQGEQALRHDDTTSKSLDAEVRAPMEVGTAASERNSRGFDINIEAKAGELRYGKVLPFDYGEIAETEGVDGDPIDVCVGPDPDSRLVLIVDQRVRAPRDDGESHGDRSFGLMWDESKVMLGFSSFHDALAAWDAYYGEWALPLIVTPLVMDDFLEILSSQKITGGMLKSEASEPL